MSPVTALLAAAFIQSIGVNTHIGYDNTAYGNFDRTQRCLEYLGASHIRDGVPYGHILSRYQQLAAKGFKFDVIVGNGPHADISVDLAQLRKLALTSPGSIASIEGPNELNDPHNKIAFNGQPASNPAVAVQITRALHSAVRADPVLAKIPVVNISISYGVGTWKHYLDGLGDVSPYVDRGNWHVYFDHGQQPAANLRKMIPFARQSAPGRPVVVTESGYFTAFEDRSDWGGVDESTQAKLTMNLLLDAFQLGATRTYIYELMEEVPNPSRTDIENTFGLFHANGEPQPAATAIHNLITVLRPTHSRFSPDHLSYSVEGLPDTGKTLLLQKATNTYDLIIWNEPQIWDGRSRSPVKVANGSVNIVFDRPHQKLSSFDPMLSATPRRRETDADRISIELSDRPVIVEIKDPAHSTED